MFDNRQTLFSSFNFTFIFLIIKQNTFQMICFVKNCTSCKLFALKFHWLAMSVKISNFYIIWSRDKAIFSLYTKATLAQPIPRRRRESLFRAYRQAICQVFRQKLQQVCTLSLKLDLRLSQYL